MGFGHQKWFHHTILNLWFRRFTPLTLKMSFALPFPSQGRLSIKKTILGKKLNHAGVRGVVWAILWRSLGQVWGNYFSDSNCSPSCCSPSPNSAKFSVPSEIKDASTVPATSEHTESSQEVPAMYPALASTSAVFAFAFAIASPH